MAAITGQEDPASDSSSARGLALPVEVATTPDGEARLLASASLSRPAAGVAWSWLGMIRDDTSLHA